MGNREFVKERFHEAFEETDRILFSFAVRYRCF